MNPIGAVALNVMQGMDGKTAPLILQTCQILIVWYAMIQLENILKERTDADIRIKGSTLQKLLRM